jgi:hypothetical protein
MHDGHQANYCTRGKVERDPEEKIAVEQVSDIFQAVIVEGNSRSQKVAVEIHHVVELGGDDQVDDGGYKEGDADLHEARLEESTRSTPRSRHFAPLLALTEKARFS